MNEILKPDSELSPQVLEVRRRIKEALSAPDPDEDTVVPPALIDEYRRRFQGEDGVSPMPSAGEVSGQAIAPTDMSAEEGA